MPTFTPVDHDPFASGPTLTPVDHDPFAPPKAPATGHAMQALRGFENQGIAAGQLTTPDVAAHRPNYLGDATIDESGNVMYKDASGVPVATDQSKHISLTDPADNKLKVYARTEDTDEGRLAAAGRLLGTGMAAGAPTARPGIATASAASVQPKASEIFSTAKPYYREFKEAAKGIEIPAQTAGDFAGRIRDSLTKANLIPELAQPIYSAVGILDKGEPLTLDALQNIKRVVGRGFQSPDKNVRDAASVASREIGKIMSEVSPAAGQSLKTADEIHSTALAVQDLQRKSDVAGLRAGRAGYGGNSVNSMRQILSPIVESSIKGRSTLFKPDEINAMREIVEGTPATDVLRLGGQVSPTRGIGANIASAAAVTTLGPGALVIPALGAASNKLASILTGKQIDQLKELVAKRSPAYAEAISKATARYERAQTELASDPSPGKLGAYISASRALSSGLTRDGFAISSGDLMGDFFRGIGPMKSAADDEKQQTPGVFAQ
jgi:hypothetical protein